MADDKKSLKAKKPTALKRELQNQKRRLRNRSFKSKVRTTVRSFEKELLEKNTEGAKVRLGMIYSLLDKGVKMGIYKTNKASRDKSRFSNRVK